ncbi:FIST signal transduction protein [Nitrincola sp.]|uniref:FIST signal transduction protein n=1 Tax=Nitrincola sp. TaxID=1926584 RepID=UPI003A931AD3
MSMDVFFEAEPSVEAFEKKLSSIYEQTQAPTVLVFAADENNWTAEALNPVLQQAKASVLGGVFPQIIYAQQNYSTGVVFVALQSAVEWTSLSGLSDINSSFDKQLEPLSEYWEAMSAPATQLVLVDGLSTCIGAMIDALFMNFGLVNNFIGGGAGSLSFVQKPCLLTPKGMLMDATLLVRLPLVSGVGVSHGWQAISQSFKVTSSDKNCVKQLDWKPAFDEYRQVVEAHSGQVFNADNFYDLAKFYPFGINKLDAEMIVRDPLMLSTDQAMVCVGEVPEGSFVRILNGTEESLLAAAAEACKRAQAAHRQQTDHPVQLGCFIDCISRVLFEGDHLKNEIAKVSGDYPLFGALTLGEIANSGKDYLEFYNKTAVLGLLSEVES